MTEVEMLSTIGRSDKDRAKEFYARTRDLIEQLFLVMDEAYRQDMRIEFQLGTDAIGRNVIMRLAIVKVLA